MSFKLIGLETREVKSVMLPFGKDDDKKEIPAKIYAKSLLPKNMTAVQQAVADANAKGRVEGRISRAIAVAKKKFESQLQDSKITAEVAERTAAEIDAKEQELENLQIELQKVVDSIEEWCLNAVADLDVGQPRPGLTEEELSELAELEAAGNLEMNHPLIEKVPFTREVMREVCGDVRIGGLISFAPMIFFSAIAEGATAQKKTKT
jgi:hypothetical protein